MTQRAKDAVAIGAIVFWSGIVLASIIAGSVR